MKVNHMMHAIVGEKRYKTYAIIIMTKIIIVKYEKIIVEWRGDDVMISLFEKNHCCKKIPCHYY